MTVDHFVGVNKTIENRVGCIFYRIAELFLRTFMKVSPSSRPPVPKNPRCIGYHPTSRSSIQTAPNRPVFSCAKSPESRIKSRTGTFEKTPQKTRQTGRSKSSRSGQSGSGIDPDGHFRGYECDHVTSGDQVSERMNSRN